MQDSLKDTPLQLIEDELLRSKGITLWVKRDDLIHPHVQGNKWRKLKYNLEQAQQKGYTTLLTFGGAYSNHIYSTAAAARLFNFKSIGIIRGEESRVMNPTLQFAVSQGMELYYMNRETYRRKDKVDVISDLQTKFGEFYCIPEGGTNLFALRGVGELIQEIRVDYDYVCAPCGTGGTIAGLVAALKGEKQVLGFSVLKGEDALSDEVSRLVSQYTGNKYVNYNICFDYHFGGYAKVKPELVDFIKEFKFKYNIPLEALYTGKMFFGLFDLIKNDRFPPGSRIVAIHTGGLQGMRF